MAVEDGGEFLRLSRAVHIGNASDKDFRREMKRAERALNGQ